MRNEISKNDKNAATIKTGRRTLPDKCFYVDTQLDFGDYSGKKEPLFTRELVKLCVTNAIKQVFGELGSATVVDVVFLDQPTRRIILRCPSSFYVKLHSSLTLATHYEGHECYFRVCKASSTLLSLDCNSRLYSF
ncbi:Ribonuclease P protein subunit p14 [Daphnia magna]|uniref:Ribonuclease P protein subunit p14 n=2 Tax=Daphnia magna TaxID=35525 RepID=A0A164ZZU6_9CRUS|nr:Ribonuclease P protein subunit p14 [Daphnia magna]